MSVMRLVVAFAVLSCFGIALSATPRAITGKEAQGLIFALLNPGGWTKLPGFTIVDPSINPQSPDFYIIHAERDNPGGGSAIGHYAVDWTTGDVWNWVSCGRYESSSLAKAQRALRRRIGLSHDEYRKVRKPGPFCEPGEKQYVIKIGRPML